MKYVTAVFILTLVFNNALAYFKAEHQLQQNFVPRNFYQKVSPLTFDDYRALAKSSTDDLSKWESPPDPQTLLLTVLESLENVEQDEQKDIRVKRMKASLSIDNPLDVLRQQYYRALARRMKFKSIEKNREHLIKTGKRNAKENNIQANLNNLSDYQMRAGQKDLTENGFGESDRYFITKNYERNPVTQKYSSHSDDLPYQT